MLNVKMIDNVDYDPISDNANYVFSPALNLNNTGNRQFTKLICDILSISKKEYVDRLKECFGEDMIIERQFSTYIIKNKENTSKKALDRYKKCFYNELILATLSS